MYLKALWGWGSEKKAFIYFYLLNIILIISGNIHNFSSNAALAVFFKPAPFNSTNCLSFGKHSAT